MINVLVKGSWQNAKREAAAHGIDIKLHHCNHDNDGHEVETVAECDSSHVLAVMDWYNETMIAPYPNGALLHYYFY